MDAVPAPEGDGSYAGPHDGEHVAGADDAGPADEVPEETAVLGAVVVPERPREVTVEEGETLDSIAARWGVDAGELAAFNAWLVPNPRSLFPGQILRLPA